MKPGKFIICVTAWWLVLVFTPPSRAQDTNSAATGAAPSAGQSDDGGMVSMMMALAKPGENHKILVDQAGEWTYVEKFWMSPDTNVPPMTYNGTASTKPVMEGRYFISEAKGVISMPGPDGKLQDMEFKGMQIDGYDNVKRQFVTTWIDNMGTGIMHFEGVYDPAAKTLTYRAEEELMPGMKVKVREVVTLTDHDHHTMEYFQEQGGHETKAMEITFTRAGKAP